MATTFLHYLGTAGFTTNSGYIVAPFNLIGSTELSALANTSTALSSTGGTSGVFNQVIFGQAQRALIYLTVAAAFTASSGGNLSGWWLHGANSSATLEKSNVTTPPPRAPDFIIPLPTQQATNGDVFFASGVPQLPYDTVKVLVQNNSGTTLGSGNHTITVAPVADQY